MIQEYLLEPQIKQDCLKWSYKLLISNPKMSKDDFLAKINEFEYKRKSKGIRRS